MPENARGKLFILSGPSGSGKGTLLREILKKYADDGIFFSVSATTRAPREGETDGVDYHFITREAFEKLLAEDGLLEYNLLSTGDMYGTPKLPLEKALSEGRTAILEIEPNGMRKVLETYPDAVKIFVSPPSLEILEHRLRKRQTENETQIRKRMDTARKEMECLNEYDYVIVNDGLEEAVREILDVFALHVGH